MGEPVKKGSEKLKCQIGNSEPVQILEISRTTIFNKAGGIKEKGSIIRAQKPGHILKQGPETV